jgi:internalin A
VKLPSASVTDDGLKGPIGLNFRHTLNLGRTQVTDAGLKSLHALDLSFTKVTDAELKELAGLKFLHTLHFSGTKMMGGRVGLAPASREGAIGG